MPATVLSSVFQSGGRTLRSAHFTVVLMCDTALVVTPMEYKEVEDWARSRPTSGRPADDRTSFADRFETRLARRRCGLDTRGDRATLLRMVRVMRARGISLRDWLLPAEAAAPAAASAQ